jgi:hypothetical protein
VEIAGKTLYFEKSVREGSNKFKKERAEKFS